MQWFSVGTKPHNSVSEIRRKYSQEKRGLRKETDGGKEARKKLNNFQKVIISRGSRS